MAKLREFADAYADALLAGDEIAAEIAVREAMDAKIGTPEIDENIIAPALWLVGELWEQGRISVADEHLATEITIRVLALQREAQRVAQRRSDRRVMLAAPAGELHIVALRMVDELLRDAGYDVVMLGADVPAEVLGTAARRYTPAVICLSSTMPGGAREVVSSIDEVQRQMPAASFVIGGRGVMGAAPLRSGVDVRERVSDVVEAVDAIVEGAGMN